MFSLIIHEMMFFSLLMVSPQPLSTRPLSMRLAGIIYKGFISQSQAIIFMVFSMRVI
jgi:hypothetical protein